MSASVTAPSARMRRRTTLVSGLGGYIDAGSIVAGSAGLALWAQEFGLGGTAVGLLGAISSNAISAGIGALVGGYLCDRYGRKRVFTSNLLVYMFGTLWLIGAVSGWMLFVGYVIVGLAVGSDVPASWSMMSETARDDKRGATGGVMQLLWSTGPMVVLTLGLLVQPLGMLGVRLVFLHLLVLAALTYLGRRSIAESARWESARAARAEGSAGAGTGSGVGAGSGPAAGGEPGFLGQMRELLHRRSVKAIAVCTGVYLFWNLMAGTNGFYQPYLLKTFGSQSDAMSVGLSVLGWGVQVLGTGAVFMLLADRVNRRALFGISILVQLAGFAVIALMALDTGTALAYILLVNIGMSFSAQHFFQLWSSELFPARLRSSAQGLVFAVVRIALGFWSFFVPVITATGFQNLALILMGFLLVSGVIGVLWGPDNRGRTLEEIEERYGWRREEAEAPAPAPEAAR
ncbi:MFS transporter [Streptomyces sp. ODS28]|uniref:MFS transporter n=1 Tax=Streptomyces sp. ODS28 TaxID=3136688 RepID=UPI0031EEA8FC